MEVQARKRRNSKPESTLANKVIKLISNRNPPKRDEDSDEQLSQSTSYSQSTAPVITDPPLCGSCKQTAVVDSTDVTCLQCCLCDEYFHGSCLEVANETLLDFLYVVSEIGGWCCTSFRLIKKVASKPSKGSKASHQQDHVNQELQIIKTSCQFSQPIFSRFRITVSMHRLEIISITYQILIDCCHQAIPAGSYLKSRMQRLLDPNSLVQLREKLEV